MNNKLSDMFATMAAVMEIKGASVFKAIAFSKVSRILESLTIDLGDAVEKGTVEEIDGIGESSCKIIEEFVRTGRSADYDELVNSIPAGLIEMLDIPSLGPKTINLLWKQRGITNVAELSAAIEQGKLDGLKGMGEKKIAALRDGIAIRAQAGQRHGLPMAMKMAEALVERVRQIKGVKQAEIAGSLRRGRETIGDVDIVCSLSAKAKGEDVTAQFVNFPEVQKINGQGQTKASILTTDGIQVDLRIVPPDNFGAALLYFTGSKDHNVRLRGRAQDMGMTLNEWGLYNLDDYDKAKKETAHAPQTKPVASQTESDIYEALSLPYIPPELREDRGEITPALPASAGGETPSPLPSLITLNQIKGDLHTHTNASDGSASIEQMAEAAIALGYEYLGITDHSQSQTIANGLSAERLLKHVKDIRKIADKLKPFRLFAGCEVDILADGRMDYEDAILAELDYVIGSPHSSLKQPTDKATDRLLRAIDNKYVTIIGHPTGRLIDRREGLPLDFPRLFQAAADSKTVLEINAGYPRFDLSDPRARAAAQAGCQLTINTDAHHPDSLQDMRWGITLARRAWLTADQVINTLCTEALEKLFASKRK